MPVPPFPKRHYESFRDFMNDLRFLKTGMPRWKELKQAGHIPNQLEKRIMLAVTSVNGCRYCAYVHAQGALKNGVIEDEIAGILQGEVGYCPNEDVKALLFAQHWAETRGDVEPETRRILIDAYGFDKAEAIEWVIRMITFGNLIGNSFDHFLYRISFGRWGKPKRRE